MAKKKSPEIVIVGAGPAGSTAALSLARRGRHVLLLDAAKFPRSKCCAGWINARAAKLLTSLDLRLKDMVTCAVEDVTFCNRDLTKTAKPKLKEHAGYIVDRAAFDGRLVKAARDAGADFKERRLVTRIRPEESGVVIEFEERKPVSGRLLVLASGDSRDLVRQVGLQLPSDATPAWTLHVEGPRPKGAAKRTGATAIVIVGVTPTGFGMAVERPDAVSVMLSSRGEREDLVPRAVELCRGLAAKGLVSVDLSDAAAAATSVPTFSFSALDMDSHVGKHTLVIGDAGGFFASASHEGIFPAMWSASIAAGVVEKATQMDFTQDALMTFDTQWRLEMADFLRQPNTDLQLLMPLIFTNQPMADRMAAAFFGGENI